MTKVSVNGILDVLNEDWSKDKRVGLPYSGKAVREALQAMLKYIIADKVGYVAVLESDSAKGTCRVGFFVSYSDYEAYVGSEDKDGSLLMGDIVIDCGTGTAVVDEKVSAVSKAVDTLNESLSKLSAAVKAISDSIGEADGIASLDYDGMIEERFLPASVWNSNVVLPLDGIVSDTAMFAEKPVESGLRYLCNGVFYESLVEESTNSNGETITNAYWLQVLIADYGKRFFRIYDAKAGEVLYWCNGKELLEVNVGDIDITHFVELEYVYSSDDEGLSLTLPTKNGLYCYDTATNTFYVSVGASTVGVKKPGTWQETDAPTASRFFIDGSNGALYYHDGKKLVAVKGDTAEIEERLTAVETALAELETYASIDAQLSELLGEQSVNEELEDLIG